MKAASYSTVLMLAIVAVGCPRGTPKSPPARNALGLRQVPVELRVEQRSTTRVPGSQGRLRVTIDDITGGQVMTSLMDGDGTAVMAPISMKSGDAVTFKLADQSYRLELKELSNALVGKDFAEFVISSGDANAITVPKKSEAERIEQLLAAIAASNDMVFIRNGAEHASKEAAEHLRAKWQAAGNEIATAEDFIDKLATKSSLSGEPYRVRKADGTELPAGDYLRGLLKSLKSQDPVAQ